MKIIQSFWTKPIFGNNGSIFEDRARGGWHNHSSHLISWALSCLQLRSFYDNVELVTDRLGKEILIDLLRLPYTSVSVILDNIQHYDPDLWALGKLTAYKAQDTPFIHVDGDVFIFEKFSSRLEGAQLLCQNLDINHVEYKKILNDMQQHKMYMVSDMIKELHHSQDIISCNAGILGGNNLSVLGRYCDTAFELIDRNMNDLDKIHVPTFNIIFEQFLFYCVAKTNKVLIEAFFKEPDIGNEPKKLVRFHKTPYRSNYIHMIANYKRNTELIGKMYNMFRVNHPHWYYFITARLKEQGLS